MVMHRLKINYDYEKHLAFALIKVNFNTGMRVAGIQANHMIDDLLNDSITGSNHWPINEDLVFGNDIKNSDEMILRASFANIPIIGGSKVIVDDLG